MIEGLKYFLQEKKVGSFKRSCCLHTALMRFRRAGVVDDTPMPPAGAMDGCGCERGCIFESNNSHQLSTLSRYISQLHIL